MSVVNKMIEEAKSLTKEQIMEAISFKKHNLQGDDTLTPNKIYWNMSRFGKVSFDDYNLPKVYDDDLFEYTILYPSVGYNQTRTFLNYQKSKGVFAFVSFGDVFCFIIQKAKRTWLFFEVTKMSKYGNYRAEVYEAGQGWIRFKKLVEGLKDEVSGALYYKLPTDEEFDSFRKEMTLSKL